MSGGLITVGIRSFYEPDLGLFRARCREFARLFARYGSRAIVRHRARVLRAVDAGYQRKGRQREI